MKTTYYKLFKTIANIIDRILFAFKMYPTKNPNVSNWLYDHRIKSTAYSDGTRHEYLGGIHISRINVKKVK